jgi:hypothetical protein
VPRAGIQQTEAPEPAHAQAKDVPDSSRDTVRLSPPESASTPPVAIPPAATEPSPAAAPGAASPPLDIPGFALVKTNVATGRKPFVDGIAWLNAQGYRAALYLRRPGEDDSAVRKQFERNNLRCLTLEVAPGSVTRELVESFNRTVVDPANRPLFVFDKDGSLAGSMWLLYFRLSEGISEEKARLEAARFGLKPDESSEHKAMADAVNSYLQQQNP